MADARNIRAGFPWWLNAGSPQITSFTLQTSTDAIEMIFQVPPGAASYTITDLGLRQTLVTGTSPVYRISLQGVNTTTGRADGTIKNSAAALLTFTPAGANNSTWQWKTLGATYAASPGEWLALVIDYSSGTINGSNNCSFAVSFNGTVWGNPHYWTVNTGVGTRNQAQPIYGWKAGGNAYGMPCQNVSNITAFNSGTVPDEYAIRWIIPAGWCSTYKVTGFDVFSGGGNWTVGKLPVFSLYSGTTVLQDFTVDTDIGALTRGASYYFDESSLSTLTAGNVYRLGFAPNDTSNQAVIAWDVAANSDLLDLPLGIECYTSTRTDAGAWTDVTTRRLFLQPIFGDFTGGSGSGVSRSRAVAGV